MTPLVITKDLNGIPTYGLAPSTNMFGGTLTADTVDGVTVPSTDAYTWLAVFNYQAGTSVWVGVNPSTPITVPSSVFGATECELNPKARQVNAGDSIEFITSDSTAEVSVIFYGIARKNN